MVRQDHRTFRTILNTLEKSFTTRIYFVFSPVKQSGRYGDPAAPSRLLDSPERTVILPDLPDLPDGPEGEVIQPNLPNLVPVWVCASRSVRKVR